MRARGTSGPSKPGIADRALWERSQKTNASLEETERFLDLAGYVDRWLDDDERECVAGLIAHDAAAASDVAAARALRAMAMPSVSDAVIARAVALIDQAEAGGEVVPFPLPQARPRAWQAATWSSLAAAMVLVGWLGFNLGSNLPGVTSVMARPYDDMSASELLDPAPLMMRDFTEGSQI
jgi:anti-sigma factor RsiW